MLTVPDLLIYLIYQILIYQVEKIESIIFYTLDKSIKVYRQLAQSKLNEAGLDITVDQWLVMNVISEKPEVSQQEIAEKVFKDNASVTRIIDLLVNKGYLKRSASPGDRRRAVLTTGVRGRRLMKAAEKVVMSYRKTALKGISAGDLERMRKILNVIIENCEKKK